LVFAYSQLFISKNENLNGNVFSLTLQKPTDPQSSLKIVPWGIINLKKGGDHNIDKGKKKSKGCETINSSTLK